MAPTCPHWCAGGHRCGLGEHRSDPERRGLVTGIRVQRWNTGQDWLEIRATLPLPGGDHSAQDLARLAMWAVEVILRTVLAGRLGPLRKAYHRLTGVRVI